jgi:hypothetical protein
MPRTAPVLDGHLRSGPRRRTETEQKRDFGGTSAAITDVMAQQALGRIAGPPMLGTDYTGEETAESPYRFGPHLQLHQASRALLKQLGTDIARCLRTPDHSVAGCLCDRWKTPNRDYWFQVEFPSILRGLEPK